MKRLLRGALALAAAALLAGHASADRTNTIRSQGQKSSGAKEPIRVPYTTNGNSAFGVYNGVSPRIYSNPSVDDPAGLGTRPAYNLPFDGARQGYSGSSNGVVPKPTLLPRP